MRVHNACGVVGLRQVGWGWGLDGKGGGREVGGRKGQDTNCQLS